MEQNVEEAKHLCGKFKKMPRGFIFPPPRHPLTSGGSVPQEFQRSGHAQYDADDF